MNRNGAYAESTASNTFCRCGSVTSQADPASSANSRLSPLSSTSPYDPVYGTQVCCTNEPSGYRPSPVSTYGNTGDSAAEAVASLAALRPTTPRSARTRHRSTRFAPVLVPEYAATRESGTAWSTAAV